jgi:hypothetical protein
MVDYSVLIRDNVQVENKQLVDVVLHLQVAFEGFSRKADATDLAINALTFRCCCSSHLLWGVLLFCSRNLYLSWQTRHVLSLFSICLEADAFKKGDKDLDGRLQSLQASCRDQPVIDKERNHMVVRSLP